MSSSNNNNNSNIENYILGEIIGIGGFSKVYSATKKYNNKEEYAIKEIDKQRLFSNQTQEKKEKLKLAIKTEIEIMNQLKENKHAIKLIEFIDTENYYYIIMEKCKCNLKDYIDNQENNKLTKELIIKLFKGFNEAYLILYKKGIIHRDLKLENLLLQYDDNNNNNKNMILKISDFGISKKLKEGETNFSTTQLGTMVYMAPETLKKVNDGNLTYKVDIWGIGIILYKLLTGEFPFGDDNRELWDKYYTNDYSFKKIEDKNWDDLFTKIFVADPKNRISFEDYINHPIWNNNINNNGILYYENKKIKYEGRLVNNIPEGEGKKYYEDNTYYIGNFKNGKPDGYGIKYRKDNSISYKGNFKNGKMEGEGTKYYEDGSYYIGNFKSGKWNGYGTMYLKNNVIFYQGNYKDNLPEGEGKVYSEDGSYYIGNFKNGQLNGYGTKYRKDNSISYKGNYKNGISEGQGTKYFTDGTYYIGNFKNGKMDGNGTKYNSDNTIIFQGNFIEDIEDN